jgi:hypothetical protein
MLILIVAILYIFVLVIVCSAPNSADNHLTQREN